MATISEIEEKIEKEAISITRGSIFEGIEEKKFLHRLNNSLGIGLINKGMGYYAVRLFNYKYENNKVSEIFYYEAGVPHYGIFSDSNKAAKIFEVIKEVFEDVEKERGKNNEALAKLEELGNLFSQIENRLNARPDITFEIYNYLLNNQKPADYDYIKDELDR
jgi:hypothetical protein